MVRGRAYVPDRGDVVWIDFNPTRGREQRGERPCLVLSFKKYNEKSGLAFVCPITSKVKGYPFEVPYTLRGNDNAILADQLRSIDWKERRARKITAAPAAVTLEVQERLKRLLCE